MIYGETRWRGDGEDLRRLCDDQKGGHFGADLREQGRVGVYVK